MNKEDFLKLISQYFDQPVLTTDDREIAFRCMEYLGEDWALILSGKHFQIKRTWTIADIHAAANSPQNEMSNFYVGSERIWMTAFDYCRVINEVLTKIKRDKLMSLEDSIFAEEQMRAKTKGRA